MEDLFFFITDSPAAFYLAAVVVAVTIFYAIGKPYLETRKPFPGMPMAANCHWLLGHVHISHNKKLFPESFLSVLHDDADVHGRVGFWIVNMPIISITKIEDARQVLKVEAYRKPTPIISHFISRVIGPKNLLFLNGKEWKQSRDAITRTFVHSFLEQSQQDAWQVSQDLIRTLQERLLTHHDKNDQTGTPLELDVAPIMKMVTSDIFGKAAFATNFDCCKTLQHSLIVGCFESILKEVIGRLENPFLPWNFFFSLPLEKNRQLDKYVKILRDFIQSLLQEARMKMENLGNDLSPKNRDASIRISLVDRLVVACDSQKESSVGQLTDDVLTDVIATLLIASYDTTSTTLSMALYLLAMHPNIQDECAREVCGRQQISSAENLVYCTAVVKESLRLYPPAVLSDRTLTKPFTFSDGYVAPKGARCFVPIYAIHRDEKYFPRPLECLPERWCQRSGEGTRWVERIMEEERGMSKAVPIGNSEALIPFSAGGRVCPGAKFAMQESTIVLANLVQAFRWKPVPGYQLKMDLHGPLPQPAHGMPLQFEKRG
jgi:cytochrome P450